MRTILVLFAILATTPAASADPACVGDATANACAGDFGWTNDCSGPGYEWGWTRTGVVVRSGADEVGVVGFDLCDTEYGPANGVMVYYYDDGSASYLSAGWYCTEFYFDFPCYVWTPVGGVPFLAPPNPGWGSVLP